MNEDKIIIYTDGSCLGNPGPGGYGIVMLWKGKRKELSGGFRRTTNNRMEILAVIKALQSIKSGKKYKIELHSDSRYVINAFNEKWLVKWESKGWKRNSKDPVINLDLWKILYPLAKKFDIEFKWVPAHSGIAENERCDILGKQAAAGDNLEIDAEYEKTDDENMFEEDLYSAI